MVSVYLAHAEALQLFPREKQALWSQLPMLTLMCSSPRSACDPVAADRRRPGQAPGTS